jgi:hypothetical protein
MAVGRQLPSMTRTTISCKLQVHTHVHECFVPRRNVVLASAVCLYGLAADGRRTTF